MTVPTPTPSSAALTTSCRSLPLASRDLLIERKGEVQARIRDLQPRVESARVAAEDAFGLRRRILRACCKWASGST